MGSRTAFPPGPFSRLYNLKEEAMQTIQETLSGLTVGPPAAHSNLTMFPLVDGGGGHPRGL